jgi:hypothetical protein
MIVDLQSRDDFLLVTAAGRASLGRAVELYKLLVDEAAARGVNSVLLDGSAITGGLSTMEQYQLGKTIADYCLSRSPTLKVAVIRKPPVDGFGAQVARNRGFIVEVFSEREEALSWLKAFLPTGPIHLRVRYTQPHRMSDKATSDATTRRKLLADLQSARSVYRIAAEDFDSVFTHAVKLGPEHPDEMEDLKSVESRFYKAANRYRTAFYACLEYLRKLG